MAGPRSSRIALAGGVAAALACGHADRTPPAAGPFGPAPPVTSSVPLDHLSGPVDVLRDTHGMVHIWAADTADALRVEGYQMARDRTAALELVRRYAEGRVAELLGDAMPKLIDSDITMRTIGLGRVAKQMYDALAADSGNDHPETRSFDHPERGVIVNVRRGDDRCAADRMIDEIARIRSDDDVRTSILGRFAHRTKITAVVADLSDPTDAGTKKALARIKRAMTQRGDRG